MLLNVAGVTDAIVVGVPDPQWGQAVVAVVAADANQPLDDTSLKNAVREHLADYKVPKAIFFEPQLARHANGKPDYPATREYACSRLAITEER